MLRPSADGLCMTGRFFHTFQAVGRRNFAYEEVHCYAASLRHPHSQQRLHYDTDAEARNRRG